MEVQNNTTDTTDVADGQKWRRLKRIEVKVFENCSAYKQFFKVYLCCLQLQK